ncbi:MAG: tetratricopeptide repeat protein [Desulfonatronovibrionaceae bacterium]
MLKYITPLLILLAASGCAIKGQPDAPLEWQLSSRADAVYNFLRYNESPDTPAGIRALEKSIASDPDPFLYLELANAFWKRTDFDSARDILKQGINRYPDDKDLYISLAKSYLAEDRKQQALNTILEYLDKNPEQWDLIEDAAALYLQENQCASALDLLQRIPEGETTAKTEYLKGKSRSCLGQNINAVQHLETAVEMEPNMTEAWAELAYVHEKSRNYAQAESIYRKLMDKQQDNEQLLLRVISLDLKLNEPDRAMLIVDQGPNDPDFKLDAAGEFITSKYFEHAKRILKKLLQKEDPPDRTYIHLAILAYDANKDIDSAVDYLDRIPEDSRMYERALRLKGSFELERGTADKAMQIAEEGINKYPENPEFWNLKAQVLARLDKRQEALEVLDQALEKWPRSADILINKASNLEMIGEQDRALEVMEQVIAMEPDNPTALNFVGYLLAEMEDNLDRALLLVKNALKQEPTNGYYVDSLAWVLFKQGDLKEAWEQIKQAVELAGDDPIIWMHYGDIAASLEKWGEAIAGYEKALELDLDQPDASRVKEKLARLKKKQAAE